MTLKLNGITLNSSANLKYQGNTLDVIKYNGTIVWEKYPVGTVIFESSTAGTYSLNLSKGAYTVYAVGGGGGYGWSNAYYTLWASGGSGSYINAIMNINTNSIINISVGKLGSNSGPNGYGVYLKEVGETGGTSSIYNNTSNATLIQAFGGTGGTADYTAHNPYASGGIGGTTYFNSTYCTRISSSNGNDGDDESVTGFYAEGVQPGASVYNGFGKGTGLDAFGNIISGTSGYIKIVKA